MLNYQRVSLRITAGTIFPNSLPIAGGFLVSKFLEKKHSLAKHWNVTVVPEPNIDPF
jgi:hypothetical protein